MQWERRLDCHCKKDKKQAMGLCIGAKWNQGNLYENVSLYFKDDGLKRSYGKGEAIKRTVEKARSQIEIWRPHQTEETG